MAPASLNDGMRQVMADIRSWYEDPAWINYGDAVTYSSGTVFLVVGDLTARYAVNRRVRAIGTTPFSVEGTISTSVFSSPNTTVTVVWDSGSMDSTLSNVFVNMTRASIGLIDNTNLSKTVITAQTQVTPETTDSILISDASDSGNLKKSLISALPIATDTTTGVVEKAIQSEVEAETADKYPDASLLKYHPGIAKAWLSYNGTAGTIRGSYGVSSVTKNATGDYTVNFTTAFSAATYSIGSSVSEVGTTSTTRSVTIPEGALPAVGSCRVITGASETNTLQDCTYISLQFFGDI